jgi:rod shape-determining protein MreD
MKAVWVGLGLGLALALQTTLASMVAGAGAPVDLVLVVVVTVAVASGPIAGLWAGTVGGLLQDALSGGVIGVGGLTKTLLGYLVGQFGSRFMIARLWHHVLVFFCASLVHAGCFVGVYSLLRDGTMTSFGAVLTQATVNAVIGVTVTVGLQVEPGWLGRRRLRRRGLARRFGW